MSDANWPISDDALADWFVHHLRQEGFKFKYIGLEVDHFVRELISAGIYPGSSWHEEDRQHLYDRVWNIFNHLLRAKYVQLEEPGFYKLSRKKFNPELLRPFQLVLCFNEVVDVKSAAGEDQTIDSISSDVSPLFDQVPTPLVEGAAQELILTVYERNPKARALCLKHHGLSCAVCGFNFATRYGLIGAGYIHVHHLEPLSQNGEEHKVDPIRDLRPVCANCHAMLHTRTPPLSLGELKALLE